MSAIKLIENGGYSSELTRHIEIGYYWLKDLVTRGLIQVIYCPRVIYTGKCLLTFLLSLYKVPYSNIYAGRYLGTDL